MSTWKEKKASRKGAKHAKENAKKKVFFPGFLCVLCELCETLIFHRFKYVETLRSEEGSPRGDHQGMGDHAGTDTSGLIAGAAAKPAERAGD